MGRAVSIGGGAAGIIGRTLGLRGSIAWTFTVRVLAAIVVGVLASASMLLAQDPAGTRFVERDSIRVVYYGDNRGAAERTLNAALAPLPLPGIPRAAILPRSTIILAPDQGSFDSLTGGRTPDWAAGVAIPSQQLIILPAFGRRDSFTDPVVTLRHELAHIALNAHVGSPVPRWFDEGYATWVSGGWDERSGWQIRLALMRGQAPPLDSLTLGWPRTQARARLAYLLSASAVRHLATSRGDRAFASFIENWRVGGSFDTAMRSTYQMTVTQYEREWRAMVRRRYGWMLALSQTAVFWAVVVVLVLVLGSRRRKMNRERMDELRREEYMLPEFSGPDREGEE